MTDQLDADDIARITASVLAKLGDRQVDAQALSQAVKEATTRETEAPAQVETTPVEESTMKGGAPMPELPTTKGEPSASGRTRIILASFGLNRPGIVAAISAVLAENLCSIEDMSQRIMQEFYTLIMIVDISACRADFASLAAKLHAVEEKLGVTIFVQHEDVFRYMHRV